MKSGYRARAFRLWRGGHKGLMRIQALVDDLIAKSEANTELVFSGLPDLKLRISREVRENAAFEVKVRRELLELEDIEIANKTDVRVLLKIKGRIETQLKTLLDLDELKSVLRLPEAMVQEPIAETVAPDVQHGPVLAPEQDSIGQDDIQTVALQLLPLDADCIQSSTSIPETDTIPSAQDSSEPLNSPG